MTDEAEMKPKFARGERTLEKLKQDRRIESVTVRVDGVITAALHSDWTILSADPADTGGGARSVQGANVSEVYTLVRKATKIKPA
jgi:hypothetical protein